MLVACRLAGLSALEGAVCGCRRAHAMRTPAMPCRGCWTGARPGFPGRIGAWPASALRCPSLPPLLLAVGLEAFGNEANSASPAAGICPVPSATFDRDHVNGAV